MYYIIVLYILSIEVKFIYKRGSDPLITRSIIYWLHPPASEVIMKVDLGCRRISQEVSQKKDSV